MSEGAYAEDRALVAACLAGDERARGRLVQHTLRAVRGSVAASWQRRGRAPTDSDLDDAVQEAYVLLFAEDARLLRQWEARSSIRTYTARVAQRLAANLHRRHGVRDRRLPLVLDAPAYGDSGDTLLDRVAQDLAEGPVDARIEAHETRDAVREAILTELTDAGRVYYQYLYVDELTVEEVSARTGATANNIYQWRSRILRAAKKALAAAGHAMPSGRGGK
ncbi:MAG: sigma-70 family RNA polymerase sigma factor [Myxococcales bacterium]|nr:sigma-70 family RNA polymerase sigma factor [Myxococcales bacterium]